MSFKPIVKMYMFISKKNLLINLLKTMNCNSVMMFNDFFVVKLDLDVVRKSIK